MIDSRAFSSTVNYTYYCRNLRDVVAPRQDAGPRLTRFTNVFDMNMIEHHGNTWDHLYMVDTGSTPVVFFNEKRTDNEERSTQRNRPLNRIMATWRAKPIVEPCGGSLPESVGAGAADGNSTSRTPTGDWSRPHAGEPRSPPRPAWWGPPAGHATPPGSVWKRGRCDGPRADTPPSMPRWPDVARTALQFSAQDILDGGILQRERG